jgi:hypothetical protein
VHVRASDVFVGVVAGAVCAVLAAAFDAGILALRFFSVQLGDHIQSGVLLLALSGAVLGGIVGPGAALLFRKPAPSRAQ